MSSDSYPRPEPSTAAAEAAAAVGGPPLPPPGSERAAPAAAAGVLRGREDRYGGLVVDDPQTLPSTPEQMTAALAASLAAWRQQAYAGVWLKVSGGGGGLAPLGPVMQLGGGLLPPAATWPQPACRRPACNHWKAMGGGMLPGGWVRPTWPGNPTAAGWLGAMRCWVCWLF